MSRGRKEKKKGGKKNPCTGIEPGTYTTERSSVPLPTELYVHREEQRGIIGYIVTAVHFVKLTVNREFTLRSILTAKSSTVRILGPVNSRLTVSLKSDR